MRKRPFWTHLGAFDVVSSQLNVAMSPPSPWKFALDSGLASYTDTDNPVKLEPIDVLGHR